MIKINRRSFFSIIAVTVGALPLFLYIKQDLYLIVYSLVLYVYALWCAFCIHKRIVNTFLVFSLFYAVLLFFGPIILYKEGYGYYTVVGNYIIISFLCFAIGYKCESLLKHNNKGVTFFLPVKNKPEIIYVMAICLFCIGMAADLIYFARSWHTIFGADLESGRVVAMKGNGLFLWLGELAWLAVYMLYEQKIMHNKYNRVTNFMIATKTVASILFGFRNAVVNPILVLFFMSNKNKELAVRKMIMLVIALAAFVGVYGAVRGGGGSAVSSLFHEFKVSSVNLNNIIEAFPETVKYQMGKTYFLDIMALFTSKVEGTTLWVKEVLKLSFSGGGVTPTVIGEFYMNWGVVGVLVGMFFTGLLFRMIERSYRSSISSIFLPCLFLGYIRPIIRGGFANVSVKLLVFIIGYCVCQCAAKKTRFAARIR